jgi:mRNA interferase RelE/StbE
MYELVFDNDTIDFLSKAPKELRERIYKKIAAAKENPHNFFERLAGREDFKLRIGDYRAIADIDDTAKKIEITLIDHRSRVYKR